MNNRLSPATASNGNQLSGKGLATKQRIVEVAADLMLIHGVEATTLEVIQHEANVSPSQLYHYFGDKHHLVSAVLDYQTETVLAAQRSGLRELTTFADLYKWRDIMINTQKQIHCIGGCPIGSLSNQITRSDHILRSAVIQAMSRWEGVLQTGLDTMRDNGILLPTAPTKQLAVSLLAAVQGGLLLTDLRADTEPLELAINTAIDYIARCWMMAV
jgi:TetR/AcrR family transcriptional repressor of nem operon